MNLISRVVEYRAANNFSVKAGRMEIISIGNIQSSYRPGVSHLVSSSVAVFIFQIWMDRFVVKDPRVAAAYKRRRAAVIDLAAAHEAAEASRKKCTQLKLV